MDFVSMINSYKDWLLGGLSIGAIVGYSIKYGKDRAEIDSLIAKNKAMEIRIDNIAKMYSDSTQAYLRLSNTITSLAEDFAEHRAASKESSTAILEKFDEFSDERLKFFKEFGGLLKTGG